MVTRSEWWSVYLFETLGGVGGDQQGGQSADYLTGSAGLDNGTLVRTIDIGQCVGQVVQRELSDLERRGHARQLAQVALYYVGHPGMEETQRLSNGDAPCWRALCGPGLV